MILIGLGSNLTGQQFKSPAAVLKAAVMALADHDIEVVALSPFYETEPVPKSDQPWFVNGVAAVESTLDPETLLCRLHDIEASLGRQRRIRWEARIIDLDILVWHDRVWVADSGLILPHPRLQDRLFVLKPLRDLCPDWVHPESGETIDVLIAKAENMPGQGAIRPLRV